MSHKRPPIPVIVLLALLVLIGGYFLIRSLSDKPDGALTASGTIETVTVVISPELGGRVSEVYVDEGQTVRTGDPLFRLDDTLLQAQRAVAAANLDLANAALETARANYDLTLSAARLESSAARTSTWRAAFPPDYSLPGWYFSRSEEIQAAQAEVDAASMALDSAQASLETLLADPANADFLAVEARLLNARAAFVVAQDVLARASLANNASDLKTAAQEAYDAAQAELQAAQQAYDALADSEAAQSIRAARGAAAAAQERCDAAQDRLLALQTGVFSPRVSAASAAVRQAVEAVAQAEANLALIDVQLAKLTVSAPADGVILTRSIQPGEVVSPGAAALKLGRLDDLTITVYVPEDRYGELSLGQTAAVTVDSFPGETFEAVIIHIADQAEFTPRNVQTVEGRSSTVYAVRLRVQDPEGKLKPGMPADVTFTR